WALVAAALLPAGPSLNVARAKGRPETAWRVLAPVGYRNLTIFPIKGPAAASGDYVTLDEGTKSGTVVIAERGALQAARRHTRNSANRQVQQAVSYNSGASVNELALVNKSGKKLLLLAGEVIVGGQQDRKDQSAVWSEVSANNTKLGTENATGTYQEVYANRQVVAQLDDYIKALEREVLQPGVVGVVVARNGKPVWIDMFANSTLFAQYWPKLLKSYAVDALGDDRDDKRPTIEEATRYLQDRDGAVSTTTQDGVYQLAKTENPAYAVFELRDISTPAPLRLHFNKMER